MSVQSSSTHHNGHIWQNKELNPDTTSICFVNHKFVNHFSTLQLNDCIAKIEKETQCSIVIHGQNSELIWFCIKHDSDQQRRLAFNLINNAINFSLIEVKLPKLIGQEPQEMVSSFRLSSPSPPPPSVLNEPMPTESNEKTAFLPSHSNQSALNFRKDITSSSAFSTNSIANNNNTANSIKKMPKSSMTRSTTEGFISSLSHSNSNRSSLYASTLKEEFIPSNSRMMGMTQRPQLNMDKKFEKLKLDNSNKYKLKNRYTVDFLLQRADTINSKKQPANWKELSEKYPSVCFSGKVISYFDPYKYHEHWEKTKKTNSELHNNVIDNTPVNTMRVKKQGYHTDDFLNLNSFQKDINNNFYSSFKQPRLNMIHLADQQQKHNNLKRFDALHYNNAFNNNNNNNNNSQNIETSNYYVKKQQQQPQIDMRHSNGYPHEPTTGGLRRNHPFSKTHFNFNN